MPDFRTIRILLLLTGILMFIGAVPDSQEIKKKQTQLEELRKEIDRYEVQIRESEKKEKSTLDLLDKYDRQSALLKKLITAIKKKGVTLEKEIADTRKTIQDLGGQISSLKMHYARYVTNVYKYGRTHDIELLLSSKSLNQLLIRSEYLKRFSSQRRRDMEKIGSQKEDLDSVLQKKLDEQKQLIAEKKREEKKLTDRAKKRKSVLAEIRRDKKNFQKELDRKKQDVKDLERLISKLIDDEKDKGGETEIPVAGSFEARKGKLRWPVDKGTLTARFGNQAHPKLGTITQNTGIDISVTPGSSVRAIADGEVSKIHWLPSYGNLVILNHRNGFRTVYAHLSEIDVDEGMKITEGDSIGKTGESLGGAILHFELYKDREKLDPEKWLKPKGLTQR
jgi:septal ring factor EnvC (AmiA/AmiB activator)